MAFLPSLSHEELHQFHRVVTRSAEVRSHFDVLIWLQGDMQRYLPHSIMIAAWGNFHSGALHHDVISPLPGVRSHNSNSEAITPLLLQLFLRWTAFGKKPFALNAGNSGFVLQGAGGNSALGGALKKMRCAMAHGINDERGSQDCLYVTFSAMACFSEIERGAMAMVLPYIDSALRQVALMPHQIRLLPRAVPPQDADPALETGLTDREEEILQWVALGKTNPEIGSILNISEFTVKNHLQRVFKKLNVSNRAQAVGKATTLVNDV